MTTTSPARERLGSIDALRGLVMVLMALDHARDFFGFTPYDPTDLRAHDSAALFMTRWVTHFCAPIFVFLAGTSAFLWGRRHAAGADGAGRRRVAMYLLTRGVWLVFLELTLVRWAWFAMMLTDWDYSWFSVQVIWALGWSMVALSALVFLPTPVVGAFGIAMIVGHNLLDGVDPARLGAFSGLFKVLHVETAVTWPAGGQMMVRYPLVPWIGVMAAGYAFGTLMLRERASRRRACMALGAALIGLFIGVRAWNGYGDPSAWSGQRSGLFTVFSFINCTKYPPSLDFLLMTLGPGIFALGLIDRGDGAPAAESGSVADAPARRGPGGTLMEVLATYGRVPLFFYVMHLVVLQFSAYAYAYARYGAQIFGWKGVPDDYYQGLAPVYVAWVCVVTALYPACRWLGGVKRRRKSWWVGYV